MVAENIQHINCTNFTVDGKDSRGIVGQVVHEVDETWVLKGLQTSPLEMTQEVPDTHLWAK